jgi:hypothetical protein
MKCWHFRSHPQRSLALASKDGEDEQLSVTFISL